MEISVDTPWQSTVARYLSSAGRWIIHIWTQTHLTNLLRVFSRNEKAKYQVGRCGLLPTLWYNFQVLGLLLTAISQYKTIATLFGATINDKSWCIQLSEPALAQASAEIPDAEFDFQNLSERRLWSQWTDTKESYVKDVWGFLDGKTTQWASAVTKISKMRCTIGGYIAALSRVLCLLGPMAQSFWGDTCHQLQRKRLKPWRLLPGSKIVSDTSFPVMSGLPNIIVTPLKESGPDDAPPNYHIGIVATNNTIISLWQAA